LIGSGWPMSEFQIVLVVVAINAGVLAVAFFAAHLFNRAVSPSGK
jgi:hypothetical protein